MAPDASGRNSGDTHRCLTVVAAIPAIELTSVVGWSGLQMTLLGLISVLVVAAGWCSWILYRRRNSDTPTERPQTGAAPAPTPTSGVDEPVRAGGTDSGLHQPIDSPAQSPPEEAFFTPGDFPARRCPECDRSFPGVFDVCPFDSTPLREKSTDATKTATEALPRQYCPDCSRRYELGASYCYHDGHTLRRDSDAASRGAPTFRVCRSCGFETRDELAHCPHDDQPLVTLDPMQRRRIKPAFPYNRCRSCGHIAPPDQTHCPTDGTLLLPEISARLTALPPTGYGSRRRVCPDCGTAYGPRCTHCSNDGTELIELN